MMTLARWTLVGCWFVVAATGAASQGESLGPLDLEDFGFFGEALAADGPRVVVAAPFAEGVGTNSGVLHVYRRDPSGWAEEARLSADDAPFNGLVGSSVAIHDDLIAAGSREGFGTAQHYGAAYVFRHTANGWAQEAKLTTPVPILAGWFGVTIAVGPDEVIVGRPQPISTNGAAYVYQRQGDGAWELVQTLLPEGATPGLVQFGRHVALSGDRLAVSSTGENLGNMQAVGSVTLYHRGPDGLWVFDEKLFAPDASAWDQFGSALELDGDWLAIGLPYDDDVINSSGAVYLYLRRQGQWLFHRRLVASDAQPDDLFGRSLDLDGGLLVVGGVNPDSPGLPIYTGSAYIFQRVGSDWVERAKFLPPALPTDTDFGIDVALCRGSVLIGAPRNSVLGEMAGEAFAFDLP